MDSLPWQEVVGVFVRFRAPLHLAVCQANPCLWQARGRFGRSVEGRRSEKHQSAEFETWVWTHLRGASRIYQSPRPWKPCWIQGSTAHISLTLGTQQVLTPHYHVIPGGTCVTLLVEPTQGLVRSVQIDHRKQFGLLEDYETTYSPQIITIETPVCYTTWAGTCLFWKQRTCIKNYEPCARSVNYAKAVCRCYKEEEGRWKKTIKDARGTQSSALSLYAGVFARSLMFGCMSAYVTGSVNLPGCIYMIAQQRALTINAH
jgi:hypothetical protein